MKALITASGQYGPFTSITQGTDRWHCDGADYPFNVIGEATIGDYVTPPPPPPSREQLKAQREASVAAIKVTTQAGNTFDGDEVSQGRMSRAIIALSTGLAPSVTWVLADNTTVQATAAELTEALVRAGQAQAAIWVLE